MLKCSGCAWETQSLSGLFAGDTAKHCRRTKDGTPILPPKACEGTWFTVGSRSEVVFESPDGFLRSRGAGEPEPARVVETPASPPSEVVTVSGRTGVTVTSKQTNPKDAVGVKKTPGFSVVPQTVIAELAIALGEGARKYGRHNYRPAGVRASVYLDASWGHQSDFWEGQDIDPESQLSHITKAIASLTVLRDSMIQGNWVDDRPPRSVVLPRQGNNAAWSRVVETVRPNDPEPPFTAIGEAEKARPR